MKKIITLSLIWICISTIIYIIYQKKEPIKVTVTSLSKNYIVKNVKKQKNHTVSFVLNAKNAFQTKLPKIKNLNDTDIVSNNITDSYDSYFLKKNTITETIYNIENNNTISVTTEKKENSVVWIAIFGCFLIIGCIFGNTYHNQLNYKIVNNGLMIGSLMAIIIVYLHPTINITYIFVRSIILIAVISWYIIYLIPWFVRYIEELDPLEYISKKSVIYTKVQNSIILFIITITFFTVQFLQVAVFAFENKNTLFALLGVSLLGFLIGKINFKPSFN